jgi:type III secretion protein T
VQALAELPAVFGPLLEGFYVQILVLALGLSRSFALMAVLPIFTRLGISGLIRNAVALALALPLMPYLASEVGRMGEVTILLVGALLVKEAMIGALLGLVFGVPFWAAESAGNLIEFQRGSTAAFLVDPAPTEDPTITATLFVLLSIMLFYGVAGPTVLVQGLYLSYTVWPVTAFLPALTEASIAGLLGLLDSILRLGLLLSGPILIVLLLVDFVLGFINRSAQQLNIFDLSFAFKGIAFAVLMPLYIGFLIGHLDAAVGDLGGALGQLRLFLR